MATVISYLGSAGIGFILAYFLRAKKDSFKWIGTLLAVVVTTLVFSMGLKIGSNDEVIGNLGKIGLYGLAFCYIPLIVTILALNIARKVWGFNHQGRKIHKNTGKSEDMGFSQEGDGSGEDGSPEKSKGQSFFRSSSFRYLVAVILGFVFGYFFVIKTKIISFDTLNLILGNYITMALLLMIFLVGMDLGFSEDTANNIKSMGVSALVFPLITGLATLITGIVIGLLVQLPMKETLAITCTFCWYSLAPNIIINAGFVTAGAIAFLANFLRVLTSLITIPLIANKIGWIETTGMPVAAAMDVCIGTITEATDKSIAIYAFVSGTIYSVIIPILVPLIVS